MNTTKQAFRQRLSLGDKEKMPLGWRGSISYGKPKLVNGKMRVRAIMECKDLNEDRVPYIRRVERTAPNKELAKQSMEEFTRDLDRRFPGGNARAEHRSISVKDAIETYMNLKVRGVRRSRTVGSYEVSATPVIAKLGTLPLDDLDATQIKLALWEPLRTRSHKRIDLLARAIECARENNAFDRNKSNPARAVPSVWDATDEAAEDQIIPKLDRESIPDAEITALFNAIKDDPKWLAFYYLAAFAGPRCSELLNLVRWQYNPQRRSIIVGRSKTVSSTNREIVLDLQASVLIEKLLAHYEATGYTGEYLFPSALGWHYRHTNFAKTFKQHMRKAGLAETVIGKKGDTARYDLDRKRIADREYIEPKWSMHNFRHTVSVRDRDIVPPIYLDAQLGHKNAQRRDDQNSIRNPYTRSAPTSEAFFAARQRFAKLVGERVRLLLPVEDQVAEDAGLTVIDGGKAA
jgi:integrase